MLGFYKGINGTAENVVRTSKLSSEDINKIQKELLSEYKKRVIKVCVFTSNSNKYLLIFAHIFITLLYYGFYNPFSKDHSHSTSLHKTYLFNLSIFIYK